MIDWILTGAALLAVAAVLKCLVSEGMDISTFQHEEREFKNWFMSTAPLLAEDLGLILTLSGDGDSFDVSARPDPLRLSPPTQQIIDRIESGDALVEFEVGPRDVYCGVVDDGVGYAFTVLCGLKDLRGRTGERGILHSLRSANEKGYLSRIGYTIDELIDLHSTNKYNVSIPDLVWATKDECQAIGMALLKIDLRNREIQRELSEEIADEERRRSNAVKEEARAELLAKFKENNDE
jgi:hypothetical protein